MARWTRVSFPGLLSHLGQDTGALPVQGAVLVEEAEHQAVGAVGQKLPGIFNGGGEFCIGVAEAALPGPDHGHDLHRGFPLGHHKLAEWWA